MFRTTVAVTISMLVCVVSPVLNAAAVDYFLKIDGIPGESTDAKHKDWIELNSFQWGVGGGATAASCAAGEIVFVKHSDKSTPMLRAASGGRAFPQGTVEIRGERHLLQGLKVKGIQPAMSPDGKPAEQLTLTFDRCATHALRPMHTATGKHFPKAELTARQGPPPVAIGLLLPAVQKVREAAVPQAPLDEILIGLSRSRPGVATIIVQGGSQAANHLQRAFQTQQKLEFLELARKDQPYMKIKFNDVLITGFQTGGSGEMPTESLSLNFTKIDIRYLREEGNPAAFKDLEASWPDGYYK